MVKCKDCGQWYKTKKGLAIHRDMFHPKGQSTIARFIFGTDKPMISKKEGQGYVWTQRGMNVPIPDLSPLIMFHAQMGVVKAVKEAIPK